MKLSAVSRKPIGLKSFYLSTRRYSGFAAILPCNRCCPAVAQVDWAMHYAAELLAPGWRFHHIQNVKFQSPLLPGAIVTLTLHWQETRQTLTFSYQRHDGETRQTASSGKIRLCR